MRRAGPVAAALALAAALVPAAPAGSRVAQVAPGPVVEGPLPGTVPGDRLAPAIEDTYPFFSTWLDLEREGYVEEEFLISGAADAYAVTGERLAEDVAYQTRIIVRRPERNSRFNGTVLVEWQNVTAGYDLDALWSADQIMDDGYAWVGVSAQRVGVDQLAAWSPARYGTLDVTGGRRFVADELSYDIFSQAARALGAPQGADPLGGLPVDTLLAVGASQSAGRMTVYYNAVLPQIEPVFDGYAFVVGSAPTRVGSEPVFQILSETDVRTPNRPADTDQFRRWEVAGAAHSGWAGQVYRRPLAERDLGGVTEVECDRPPFSRVPLQQVLGAAYDHLVRWVERGTPPPTAEPLAFNADGTKARDELGHAVGGIRLSQVEVPTALNTGDNSGPSFCRLFGSHEPFDDATLDRLYASHHDYVQHVRRVDKDNVAAGYLGRDDQRRNLTEAKRSDVGG
ncbi:MAG TPA: alpha/beta hydrolase domain-containing protein [Acidimicrobiales bacterium]|nr:alpha/beta hydrolase domain-containing protein [Acidimicrobiales bacterium]